MVEKTRTDVAEGDASVWLYWKAIVCYDRLSFGKTINSDHYYQQLTALKRTIERTS